MDLRRIARIALAVGLALALGGFGLFALTGDLRLGRLVWPGFVTAFAASAGLILAGVLPRHRRRGGRAWAIVTVGGAPVLAVPALLTFRLQDPMILMGGILLLVVYAAVAVVVMGRRTASDLQGQNAA